MVVCSYAVWQYREERMAEGSRRNLLKNDVMLMGSWYTVGKCVYGETVVIGSKDDVFLGLSKACVCMVNGKWEIEL